MPVPVRRFVNDGTPPAGTRKGRATIADVAADAGVSVATVSNVLNRPYRVAPSTLDRVVKSIEQVGFVRNEAARQLASGTSTLLGFLVSDVRNPFWLEVARGVEDVAHRAGQMVVLCNTDGSNERARSYVSLVGQRLLQGLIAPSEFLQERDLAAADAGHFVAIGLSRPELDVCSVAHDDELGGRLAMTHLLSRGHRRICYVTGPLTEVHCARRWGGAIAAAVGKEDETDLQVMEMQAMTIEQGRRAGEQLVTMKDRPSAVFCANDLLALGVEQVVLKASLRIPDDVAIVGYDDIELAAEAAVPITSVSQSGYKIGHTAVTLLFEGLAASSAGVSHAHGHRLIKPTLTERSST